MSKEEFLEMLDNFLTFAWMVALFVMLVAWLASFFTGCE